MSTAIFIRSYDKDFEWLSYCFRSIRKYCTGFDQLILVIPNTSTDSLPETIWEHDVDIYSIEERTDGYIDQQISKLQAHKFTSCDQILYVDSDCCFFDYCEPECFMHEGKPILLKTDYEVFRKYQRETGQAQSVLHWKAITEKALGFSVQFEFMRRIPIMFLRETLLCIDKKYPNLADYCCKVPNKQFSEFNFIGAFANQFHPQKYSIMNTEKVPLPQKYAEQYWSWGGLNDDLRSTMEAILE